MDRLLEWFLKLVILLLLAPIVLSSIVHGAGALLAAVLPWLVLFGVIAGITAGLAAAVVLRRRLPSHHSRSQVSPGFRGEPIRRPRGPRARGDD